ncbi:uncharacterized protein EKO05_0010916 [Ascochyta rabiei]|uniref:Uncharacterized protein n=1 Tax=Didymella rabiei TaxID=5454 RepID=A0A162ZGP4_DIDRA|nr:uncharacterized protein EKO05_0010916 [Ascochyta rabiei]KZM20590.1 hypothetical protein ST47_g8243 [Ascochyta rabiei]UPX20691.1 hypothetical protein EKO05_0010916 [Ascochyta rabiei]
MCRIEEKIYVRTDGHQSMFQDITQCDEGRRRGKECSDSTIRRTKYHDPTPSPAPSNPRIPSGSYQTRTRQPSTSSRPSTRDGPVTLKPEIIIEIGSKKGKGKGYPTVSISTKDNHRSSTSSTSAIDSPGSDASHKLRTGYADTPLPLNSNYAHSSGLQARSDHYRNPSSDESFTGSLRFPSHYRTSDEYDTPSLATATTATSSGTRPVIHNGARHVPSPINTTCGQSGSPSSPYRTTVVTPQGVYQETTERTERSHHAASSYAPEITGRDEDRQRRREEQRRRQEAKDREIAAKLIQEENKRFHFEPSRAQDRAEQRADKTFAGRADGRERLRQERQERDAQAAREAARRGKPSSKPSKPSAPSRRNSVRTTPAEAAMLQQLLDAEALQMRNERAKTDAIEKEEQRQQQLISQQQQQQQQSDLQQRQQDPEYYNPRGPRTTIPGSQGSLPRRNSLSGQARPDFGRSGSTRGAAVNPPRQDRRPPVSFPETFNARVDLNQSCERRPSLSQQDRPFNPFTQPAPPQPADPWESRNMRDALPDARGPQIGHNFPQQASHRMNQAFYDGEHEHESERSYQSRRR